MIYAVDRFGVLGDSAKKHLDAIRIKHSAWFDHGDDLNVILHDLIPKLNAHQFNVQELLVATLFLRALTQYQSVIILARQGLPDECKIILRSLIELVIYLRAIHKDMDLAQEYVRSHDRERLKMLATYDKSDFLQSRIPPIDSKTEREKILKSLGDKKKDIPLSVYAKAAGLLDVYHTAYKVLCGTVHTGVEDLQRHFNSTDPSTLTEIRYGVSDDEIDHILLTGTELMLHAMQSVGERFSIPETTVTDAVVKKHKELAEIDSERDKEPVAQPN